MLIPIFIFALDPSPALLQDLAQSEGKQDTKQILPRTPAQLVAEAAQRKKQTNKSIEDLLACLKLFESNSNKDIMEMYNEFQRSNPNSDIIDFLQYLYQIGIVISGRSNNAEKTEVYQIIMITSTDKKAIYGLLDYSDGEAIAQYCIGYGMTKVPKRMSKESVVIKFGSTQPNQFSKIYHANGLYRVYYLIGSSLEAVDYFEKLNQGTWKFSRDVTLLGRSFRF